MGDYLKKKYHAEIDLIAGSGGVFEVSVDGSEIFSKAKSGRFPEEAELSKIIDSL